MNFFLKILIIALKLHVVFQITSIYFGMDAAKWFPKLTIERLICYSLLLFDTLKALRAMSCRAHYLLFPVNSQFLMQ